MSGHQWMHVLGIILIAAAGWVTLAIVLTCAWSSAARSHRRRTAPEFEASAYGPMRNSLNRLCELRGHDYHLNADGTHWVCVRGDDKVARLALSDDITLIENYANGEATA